MIRLLRIEWLKLRNSRAFIIIGGFYVLLMALVAWGMGYVHFDVGTQNGIKTTINLGKLGFFDFPYIWKNISYIAGFFKYILAILVVIFISNEYSYRTVRQNVIDGLSRQEFITSKLLMILMYSVVSTILVVLITTILGILFSNNQAWDVIFLKIDFVLAYFLETLTYLIFSFFVAYLIKRTGFVIITLVLYTFVIEPIAVWQIGEPVGKFLPIQSIREMSEIPFKRYIKDIVELNIMESADISAMFRTIVWGGVFTWLTYYLFGKRDILS
ncbi:MAG: ABC transporter permease [Flavobacteriales bacterium]|nr:ABC transporter permease [Flavobacteriales bacterium]